MFKGEIVKGGSYNTLSGETATGCTIYTEKFHNSSVSYNQNDLVYMPYLNMMEADKVIKKGFSVVFGSELNNNSDKEATELKCKYIWKNNTIVKLKY
jgi:hypothetical protein